MHLFFGTRGIKQDVDNFIRDLQAQYFPLKVKNKDGSERVVHVQGILRPFQMWEYVFPKEYEQVVVNTICHKPNPVHKKLSKFMPMLRKVLGAKKALDVEEKGAKILTSRNINIDILTIGKKDDKTKEIKEGDVDCHPFRVGDSFEAV